MKSPQPVLFCITKHVERKTDQNLSSSLMKMQKYSLKRAEACWALWSQASFQWPNSLADSQGTSEIKRLWSRMFSIVAFCSHVWHVKLASESVYPLFAPERNGKSCVCEFPVPHRPRCSRQELKILGELSKPLLVTTDLITSELFDSCQGLFPSCLYDYREKIRFKILST